MNSVTNSQELFTPDEHDAYESDAKEDAANGLNKVSECYVAGLNPTNATDVFAIDAERNECVSVEVCKCENRQFPMSSISDN